MRIIWAGVLGAAGGAVLVWSLATWHHLNLVPMDLQAAVSALIGGALSFLAGTSSTAVPPVPRPGTEKPRRAMRRGTSLVVPGLHTGGAPPPRPVRWRAAWGAP